jgi:4-hydroxy-3-polyprenylbenzoate decarboxylase
MMRETLRDVLVSLEQHGKLIRVFKSVDVGWEVACLVKWMFQAVEEPNRRGLWFENIAGHNIPVVIGALGVSAEVYAHILGVVPEEINATWERALLNPVAPLKVTDGPCQETVLLKDQVRLERLPIPTWTPGKDIGPYITTTVVTSNAHTRRQNIGFYRTRVRDAHSVVSNLNPGRQGFLNACTWTEQGLSAPIAWVIGAHPVVQYAATANLPWGMDEIEVAGGVLGKPMELVKATSVDLLVPADAEIVIEGEIYPGETDVEGPFGEFAGYMGPVAQKPACSYYRDHALKKPHLLCDDQPNAPEREHDRAELDERWSSPKDAPPRPRRIHGSRRVY